MILRKYFPQGSVLEVAYDPEMKLPNYEFNKYSIVPYINNINSFYESKFYYSLAQCFCFSILFFAVLTLFAMLRKNLRKKA